MRLGGKGPRDGILEELLVITGCTIWTNIEVSIGCMREKEGNEKGNSRASTKDLLRVGRETVHVVVIGSRIDRYCLVCVPHTPAFIPA
eukprot:1962353-Rhodomonas_salina.5